MKRVTFPSGKRHIVGCGIYNMRMDKAFIEDVVNRAAALIAERGKAAFDQLRDRTGPFVFMDTYVFVDSTDGIELEMSAELAGLTLRVGWPIGWLICAMRPPPFDRRSKARGIVPRAVLVQRMPFPDNSTTWAAFSLVIRFGPEATSLAGMRPYLA